MKAHVRHLGLQHYEDCLKAMQDFTRTRHKEDEDEIWLVEHPSVFTLGKASRRQHLLDPGDIPVIASERGGQVTYHGPGQVIAYVMLDLARRKLMVRELVFLLEQACIDLLLAWGIPTERRANAPGVYLGINPPLERAPSSEHLSGSTKIAALGLKISRSCSYHGLALNVAMDLAPFHQIDPCGYPGLQVTDMRTCLGYSPDCQRVANELAASMTACLDKHFLERMATT